MLAGRVSLALGAGRRGAGRCGAGCARGPRPGGALDARRSPHLHKARATRPGQRRPRSSPPGVPPRPPPPAAGTSRRPRRFHGPRRLPREPAPRPPGLPVPEAAPAGVVAPGSGAGRGCLGAESCRQNPGCGERLPGRPRPLPSPPQGPPNPVPLLFRGLGGRPPFSSSGQRRPLSPASPTPLSRAEARGDRKGEERRRRVRVPRPARGVRIPASASARGGPGPASPARRLSPAAALCRPGPRCGRRQDVGLGSGSSGELRASWAPLVLLGSPLPALSPPLLIPLKETLLGFSLARHTLAAATVPPDLRLLAWPSLCG
ncbi:uncharacterized protein LOC128928912 [Callithrix jacchus]